MTRQLSQKAIELYDDECVDAGGTVPISAWDAVFVFMNVVNKKTGKNFGFDLAKIEDLFLLFINRFFAKFFKFDLCDSALLKLIVKDMSEMGYFGRNESADSSVFWLNDAGIEFADEIFDSLPNDAKEITNRLVEAVLENYVEVWPLKTAATNSTKSLLIQKEPISDIDMKLSRLLSASIEAG